MWKTKFCNVAPDICWLSVGKLLYFSPLALVILSLILDFWKTGTLLTQDKEHLRIGVYMVVENYI